MTAWLLRVEGVNFAATLYDTNDLSTVRGASIGLLHAGDLAEAIARDIGAVAVPVFSGASQAAICFTAPAGLADIPAAIAAAAEKRLARPGAKGEPFPHLDFIAVAVPLGDGANAEEAALERATARTRQRQFRRFTTPAIPFSATARQADALDGFRPATHELKMRQRVLGSERQLPAPLPVSGSVRARKDYGRDARQGFYRMEIALGQTLGDAILGMGNEALSFTDDLEAMVEDGPTTLPLAVANKIAVVYADGNGFGDARAAAGSTSAFSAIVRPLQRALLARLLRPLAAGARGSLQSAFALDDGGHFGLRFETLLWGGDEMCFVMPAWLATGFVGNFLSAQPWEVGKVTLTHALGVAIADRKTPIRQLQYIAKESADSAKEAGLRDRNSVTFDIFESLAPPDDDLSKARVSLYGAAASDDDFPKRLAFDGAGYDDLMKRLTAITADFPRSQIYAALRAARLADGGNLLGAEAQVASDAGLAAYGRRAGRDSALGMDALILPARATAAPTKPDSLPPVLDLARIALLWDYVEPLPGLLDYFASEAS